MVRKSKLTSGRLQDIEATLEIAKKQGLSAKVTKATLPFCWNYSMEQRIRILEFERKQEIEKLRFFNNLKSDVK